MLLEFKLALLTVESMLEWTGSLGEASTAANQGARGQNLERRTSGQHETAHPSYFLKLDPPYLISTAVA